MNPLTPHNDHELPHIVAPGSAIEVLGTFGSGTSEATAITTGATLLSIANDYPSFREWPEMTRAVMIATATHNVHGGKLVNFPSGLPDRRDGAGLINSYYGVLLDEQINLMGPYSASTSRGRWAQTLDFNSEFFGVFSDSNSKWSIRASMNGRMRVVIAWDSTTTGCTSNSQNGCNGDTIDADLDLHVKRMNGPNNGSPACASQGYDSTWEICDFPVTSGEEFQVYLRKFQTNSTSTYLGLAWFNYDHNLE